MYVYLCFCCAMRRESFHSYIYSWPIHKLRIQHRYIYMYIEGGGYRKWGEAAECLNKYIYVHIYVCMYMDNSRVHESLYRKC